MKNYALNKYGIFAYRQTNISLTYQFAGPLSGFTAQALWVGKTGIGDTYTNDRYVINKVDMNQLNLILNYRL